MAVLHGFINLVCTFCIIADFFFYSCMFFSVQKKRGGDKHFTKKKAREILNGFGDNIKNVSFCLDLQNWIPIGLGFSWDACKLEEMQMLYVLLSICFAHWSLLGLEAIACPYWLASWRYFYFSSPFLYIFFSLVFKNSYECWFHPPYFLQLFHLGIICKCFIFS